MTTRNINGSNGDPHNLARFIEAQRDVFEIALGEIRAGRKRSHWMWYLFPQFQGLGFSSTSVHFAIQSVAEAQDYLVHPVLGERLVRCCEVLLNIPGQSALAIFGSPDDMKLRSSMTLFASVSSALPEESVFQKVLAKFFDGQPDEKTLELLAASRAV